MLNKEELPDPLRSLREDGDGFRTPDPEYFAGLTERVLQQDRNRTAGTAKVRRLGNPYRWVAAVAAVVLLAVAWFVMGERSDVSAEMTAQATAPSSEELLAEISPEEIEVYIGNELADFESELYALDPEND